MKLVTLPLPKEEHEPLELVECIIPPLETTLVEWLSANPPA